MTTINIENSTRNPNISKWNILFEREGKQWMSVRPQEGTEVYTCYACRELFGSKSSFLDHVNRFTIVLNFKCNLCSTSDDIQFYNPCALLLHSRQHYTPFGGYISLDNIKVSCLPFGLIGFPPHHDIPMIYNVKDDNASGMNINTRFYAPTKSNKGKNVVNMIPTILLFYHYRLNGTPPSSLILKQISTNIPRCIFVRLESNAINSTVINAFSEKKASNPEVTPNCSEVINTGPSEIIENTTSNTKPIENNNSTVVNENFDKDGSNRDNNVQTENIINPVEEVRIKEEVADSDISNILTPPSETTEMEKVVPTVDSGVGNTEVNACPECGVHIPCTLLMSAHFTNTNPLNYAYHCDICKYIAASACSFNAHKRLHIREAPFICPECGRDFETNILLLDHLEDVCFHLAKQVRLRCPKRNCCKVFAQLVTFTTHFEVHIQTLNKCTLCAETFYAVRDFTEHCETAHSNAIPSELIYKCTICKNSTIDGSFRSHIEWHCNDETLRVYVYCCKFCRNFFRSAFTYASHLLRCAKKDLTIEELRRLKKSNAAMVCLHCNYVIRLITKFADCPRCGRSVNTSTAMQRIFPTENNIFPRTIKCILCYEDLIFTKVSSHECRYKHPQVVLAKEDYEIQQILNMKIESPNSGQTPDHIAKKKRRKLSTSPILPKHRRSTQNAPEPQLEKPVPFEGTYCCKICDFKSNDRISFHQHILVHRSVSTSYQCMECGECFVVKPSFHKHLLYYHKITDVDDYVKENQCVDESAISELRKHMRIESGEINDDVEENQCKVCLRQFEDSLELSKHFRIHGMAFLKNNK